MSRMAWVLSTALLFLGGCSRDGISQTGNGSASEGGDDESAGPIEPEVCNAGIRDGLTCTEERCHDLQSDTFHCGACGHVCENAHDQTYCVQGVCAPFSSPCIYPEDGPTKCADVCESLGTVCSEAPKTEGGCGEIVWGGVAGDPRACEIGRAHV